MTGKGGSPYCTNVMFALPEVVKILEVSWTHPPLGKFKCTMQSVLIYPSKHLTVSDEN